MMAADTVLQQYFTELQSEVKAIAVNADLETAYTELEGAFTEQVSRLMSEMGLLAAEPELCPFQGTVNGAVARVSASRQLHFLRAVRRALRPSARDATRKGADCR